MAEPLLHRLPSISKYDKKYQVHGYRHLLVEAYYVDAEDGKPEFGCWWLLDTRFSDLDRHRRRIVFSSTYLSDIRSWLKAGGAALWDPDKRKDDETWKPLPEGWAPGDSRLTARRRTPFRPFGEKGSRAVREATARHSAQGQEPSDYPLFPGGLKGKKYAVAPGWVRTASDGQRHWIGFGALTWLYGVNPTECIEVKGEQEHGWNDELRAHLIWLYPQNRYEDYASMKEELAKGEDAFKLTEP